MNKKSLCRHRALAAPFLAATLAIVLGYGMRAQAGEADQDSSRIRQGFAIAPVPLNLAGKDRQLVGLGSYLVNAVASCNDCHSAGPVTGYAPGGNPYFKGNPPTVVNQATYLGGGNNFGSLLPGTPNIVSRNLTPDRTGRPAGGLTLPEFRHILRTGEDQDRLHPNCSQSITSNCFPPFQPFNGDLLQIMPWPVYQNLSDRDIHAIYEYLSAVPCISGPPSGVLHNDCT
jgi:cytochrome c553